MSNRTQNEKTWLPDDASAHCMQCGAEFGRILGASRHHCRASGELICQTCVVVAEKQSHVVEPGVEIHSYLAPKTSHTILKRPDPSSVIDNVFQSFKAIDTVKFSHSCNTDIELEHTSFRQACFLLGTLSFLSPREQMNFVITMIRAYLAYVIHPTGMALLGKIFHDRIKEGFYMPKVSSELRLFDRDVNLIISSVIYTHLEGFTTKLVEHCNTHFTQHEEHLFLASILNASHVPNIRVDILNYLLMDEFRALHILLSRYVFHYDVHIVSSLQNRSLLSILKKHGVSYLVKYPLLLNDIIRDCNETPEPYEKFIQAMQMSFTPGEYKKQMTKLLCTSPNQEYTLHICDALQLDSTAIQKQCSILRNKLLALVQDTERLEHSVNVPWTEHISNDLAQTKSPHPIVKLFSKICANFPRTIHVNHVFSTKNKHLARLFQEWLIFVEPNTQINHVLRHMMDVVSKSSAAEFPQPYYNNTRYFEDIAILPGNISQTRIVHLQQKSSTITASILILVTMFLMEHLKTFIEIPEHESLNLVEIYQSKQTELITSCLTYSSLGAIRRFVLSKSLHANTVTEVSSILQKMVNAHLPEFYFGLVGLRDPGVDKYTASVVDMVKNQNTEEFILKYLV